MAKGRAVVVGCWAGVVERLSKRGIYRMAQRCTERRQEEVSGQI